MIPELAYVMLACARIGAVHSIIFGGFSADSIAGRIKNSINLEQQTLVNEDGTFKSVEEIKILISQAGLQGKDGYISYCNTGHWASIGWFALSEIAKQPNVKNYDGSMVDWTFDPNREVIKG